MGTAHWLIRALGPGGGIGVRLTALREPHLFSLLLPDCEYEFWFGRAGLSQESGGSWREALVRERWLE